jgi:hypothetical protein
MPPAASFSRFDTPALKWQKVYGLMASAVVFGLLFHLLIAAPSLSVPQRAAYAALLVTHAVGMAWVFEGKPWALHFEAARATLVFGALAAGLWFGPVALPAQLAALGALTLSLAVLGQARAERARSGVPLAGVTGVRA